MMTLLNGLQLVAASQPECFNNGPVHAGFVVAEADTATDGHGIGRNVVSIGGSVCIGVDKLSGAKETADECDEMNRSFGHLIFLSLWNHSSWLMDLNCLSILKKAGWCPVLIATGLIKGNISACASSLTTAIQDRSLYPTDDL